MEAMAATLGALAQPRFLIPDRCASLSRRVTSATTPTAASAQSASGSSPLGRLAGPSHGPVIGGTAEGSASAIERMAPGMAPLGGPPPPSRYSGKNRNM